VIIRQDYGIIRINMVAVFYLNHVNPVIL
jgi:hypothetical protein